MTKNLWLGTPLGQTRRLEDYNTALGQRHQPHPWQYDTAPKVKALAGYLLRAFAEERHFFDAYEDAMVALVKAFDEFRAEHVSRVLDQGDG